MPPFSFGIAEAVQVLHLESRGLGGNNTSTLPSLSDSQGHTLQVLACTFSAISVASAMVAFLWFVKMRRTFRHDLIMLLIQSDMFKALWFMIYPIVVFTRGPVADNSTFCQVSGFFLALSIEASDFAALMIAIHTALYIFRPRSSGGEGGLYPYRRIAYGLYFILPLISASLAFVNQQEAYVADGTYCYLPVRPFWYRLALAWIPRYIIFIFILGIYASIYYYVRCKFNNFTRNGSANSANSPSTLGRVVRSGRRTVPPTPQLISHGLIPPSNPTSMTENDLRKPSVSTVDSSNPTVPSRVGAHRFIWGSFSVGNDTPPSPPSEPSNVDVDSFTGPSTPRPIAPTSPHPISPRPMASIDTDTVMASRATSWRDGFVRRFSPRGTDGNSSTRQTVLDIFAVLRNHPDDTETSSPPMLIRLMNSQGQTFAEAEMTRTRDKIRRQLRFLFIYPLVYIGMWILPFVSHVMQYDDDFATNPPFGLTCVTTIFICSQAAVDCWLFSTREKPWRQIPGTDGSFWASLKLWSGWGGMGKGRATAGPGKSREEMVREAKAAYQRRDEELAQRRIQTDAFGPEPLRRGERSWWEVHAIDGAMSPVSEELSNPMESPLGPTGEQEQPSVEPTGKATMVAESGSEPQGSEETVVHKSPPRSELVREAST